MHVVVVLQKFINNDKIKSWGKLNLNNIWNLIVGASGDKLRRKVRIVNSTTETM